MKSSVYIEKSKKLQYLKDSYKEFSASKSIFAIMFLAFRINRLESQLKKANKELSAPKNCRFVGNYKSKKR